MATEYEYTRFGEAIQRRLKDSTDDWQTVTGKERAAGEAWLEAEFDRVLDARRGSAKLAIEVTRSPENEERARKLGLTGDELADRLAKPDANDGTRRRVSEAEFDNLMGELGLDPQEARDRFAGRHA